MLVSSAAAYSVQFSKDVKNEKALRQYLAEYDQSRLQGVSIVNFDSDLAIRGLFLIGEKNKNRIIINPAFIHGSWHFNELMDHETAHAICWRTQKDVSHNSNCFKQESLSG